MSLFVWDNAHWQTATPHKTKVWDGVNWLGVKQAWVWDGVNFLSVWNNPFVNMAGPTYGIEYWLESYAGRDVFGRRQVVWDQWNHVMWGGRQMYKEWRFTMTRFRPIVAVRFNYLLARGHHTPNKFFVTTDTSSHPQSEEHNIINKNSGLYQTGWMSCNIQPHEHLRLHHWSTGDRGDGGVLNQVYLSDIRWADQ